jgi:uncharacterized protein YuzE
MRVLLSCGIDDLTIWFGSLSDSVDRKLVNELPECSLIFDSQNRLRALQISANITQLLPEKLAQIVIAHAKSQIAAELTSTYEASVDMGYIYLEERGPGCVQRCINCETVILDIGKDGALIGIELFSPSTLLPELVAAHKN